jgi:hypothetical protein
MTIHEALKKATLCDNCMDYRAKIDLRHKFKKNKLKSLDSVLKLLACAGYTIEIKRVDEEFISKFAKK